MNKKYLPTLPDLPGPGQGKELKKFFKWKDNDLVTKHQLGSKLDNFKITIRREIDDQQQTLDRFRKTVKNRMDEVEKSLIDVVKVEVRNQINKQPEIDVLGEEDIKQIVDSELGKVAIKYKDLPQVISPKDIRHMVESEVKKIDLGIKELPPMLSQNDVLKIVDNEIGKIPPKRIPSVISPRDIRKIVNSELRKAEPPALPPILSPKDIQRIVVSEISKIDFATNSAISPKDIHKIVDSELDKRFSDQKGYGRFLKWKENDLITKSEMKNHLKEFKKRIEEDFEDQQKTDTLTIEKEIEAVREEVMNKMLKELSMLAKVSAKTNITVKPDLSKADFNKTVTKLLDEFTKRTDETKQMLIEEYADKATEMAHKIAQVRGEVDAKLMKVQSAEDVAKLKEEIELLKMAPPSEGAPKSADVIDVNERMDAIENSMRVDRQLFEDSFEKLQTRVGEELQKLVGWIDFFNKKVE